jgi:hypothetical protein
MISKTFGAPFGAASIGGQASLLFTADWAIVPVNGSAGAGSTVEFGVKVALGDPGVPVITCAETG